MVKDSFYIGKVVPELIDILQRRYSILRTIESLQPIGRRTLAESLSLAERAVRNDVDILKKMDLIKSEARGMSLTSSGKKMIDIVSIYLHELRGMKDLENKLMQKLNIEKITVVEGNIDSDIIALRELGRRAAYLLQDVLINAKKIAVGGGHTLAELAKHIKLQERTDMIVLPARGGLGEKVEIQANTLAAKVAEKLGASYRLLHVPDYMSQRSAEQLLRDPFITPILQQIRETDVLIHGIGNPFEMAKRRGFSWDELESLNKNEAKGEAFGYFFNATGSIIFTTPSVGLKLEDLSKIEKVLAIAGGESKAEAIQAVSQAGFINWLITDEAAARKILHVSN